ncbi:uncharacterized protein LOC143174330 isoform X2 [Nomia melanderi]|uniref:uncharacterized protein LOC143174330 isoform X2 n=1 Tax=Nomia melanderi TaxID=2448451 RepID=UPI003FCC990A
MGKSVNIFKTQYFNFCRILLIATGQWPYQNKVVAIPLRSVICTMLIIIINAQICKIYESGNSVQTLVETVPYLLSAVIPAMRYRNSLMNIKRRKNLFDRIKYDWECAVLNNEDHIFESYAKGAWKLSMVYATILNSMMVLYVIVEIVLLVLNRLSSWSFTSLSHLPIQVEFFIDEDKYFYYILAFTNLTVSTGCMAHLALDMEMNIIINHACTMFAIVGQRLEKVFRINLDEHKKRAHVNQMLIRTIKYHRDALQFVDCISSYCSGFYVLSFYILLVNFSILSFHAWTVIRAFERLEIFVFPVLSFSGECVMAAYNTVLMQWIIDASSAVFHRAYCGEWYTAPISQQKTLLLIMRKCMKPAAITFANVFTLSMQKYAMAAETVFSYFMVLCSLQ